MMYGGTKCRENVTKMENTNKRKYRYHVQYYDGQVVGRDGCGVLEGLRRQWVRRNDLSPAQIMVKCSLSAVFANDAKPVSPRNTRRAHAHMHQVTT